MELCKKYYDAVGGPRERWLRWLKGYNSIDKGSERSIEPHMVSVCPIKFQYT